MTPKKLRQLTGLSQRAFAKRIGVNKSTVERAEKSDVMPERYRLHYEIWKRDKDWLK